MATEEYWGLYEDRIYTDSSELIKSISFNGDTDINKIVLNDDDEVWHKPCKVPVYGLKYTTQLIQLYNDTGSSASKSVVNQPYMAFNGQTIEPGNTLNIYVPYGYSWEEFNSKFWLSKLITVYECSSIRNTGRTFYNVVTDDQWYMGKLNNESVKMPTTGTITADTDTYVFVTGLIVGMDYPTAVNYSKRFLPGQTIKDSDWFAPYLYTDPPAGWPPQIENGGLAYYVR